MNDASAIVFHHKEMSCTLQWPCQWQQSLSFTLKKPCFLLLKYGTPSNVLLEVMCEEVENDVWIGWKINIYLHNHGSHPPLKDTIVRIHRTDVATFHLPEAPNPTPYGRQAAQPAALRLVDPRWHLPYLRQAGARQSYVASSTGRGRVLGKTRWYILFFRPAHHRVHHLVGESRFSAACDDLRSSLPLATTSSLSCISRDERPSPRLRSPLLCDLSAPVLPRDLLFTAQPRSSTHRRPNNSFTWFRGFFLFVLWMFCLHTSPPALAAFPIFFPCISCCIRWSRRAPRLPRSENFNPTFPSWRRLHFSRDSQVHPIKCPFCFPNPSCLMFLGWDSHRPSPTIDLTKSSQKRVTQECLTDQSKPAKKWRAPKKKIEGVELDDTKDESEGLKHVGPWKDHWVIQLITIRGEMQNTFSAPPKQGIVLLQVQFYFIFLVFFLPLHFLGYHCWFLWGLPLQAVHFTRLL